jgi:hypothetical protein
LHRRSDLRIDLRDLPVAEFPMLDSHGFLSFVFVCSAACPTGLEFRAVLGDAQVAQVDETAALRMQLEEAQRELDDLRAEVEMLRAERDALADEKARIESEATSTLESFRDAAAKVTTARAKLEAWFKGEALGDDRNEVRVLFRDRKSEDFAKVRALGDTYVRPFEGWTSLRVPFLHRSVHDQLTHAGLAAVGADELASRIASRVRSVDLDQSSKLPPFRPNEAYRAECHFDRDSEVGVAAAFAAGVAHVREKEAAFVAALSARRFRDADDALGHVLHARQDVASHSNLVDLSEESRARVTRLVMLETDGGLPDGFNLTWYDAQRKSPGDPEPESSDRALFEHNHFSNDESQLEIGERTKYALAFDLGVDFTRETMLRLRRLLVDAAPAGERDARATLWEAYLRGERPRR